MEHKFYSNGKLLLTGEYFVLDGATALALPTTYGQDLLVNSFTEEKTSINWKSYDTQQNCWFSLRLKNDSENLKLDNNANFTEEKTAERIVQLLNFLKKENSALFTDKSLSFTTHLGFNRDWGLGSSSTLIANLAKWAKINPYKLLKNSFGGSGYDIACAMRDTPILYTLQHENPVIESVTFKPSFAEKLFFVHLNQKQDSREAIAHYRKQKAENHQKNLKAINKITQQLLESKTLQDFEKLLDLHEKIVSAALNISPIKQRLFHDYPGSIKSLGGWGGDFILATGNQEQKEYFLEKGFPTIIDYDKMILNKKSLP